jgi:hypothetical protein
VSNKGKLPPEVIRHWPEVQSIPVDYLDSIRVEFNDGKIWEIELEKDAKPEKNVLEDSLSTFFEEYSESIANIDFRLNTHKVINDVKARTKTFMKKRK